MMRALVHRGLEEYAAVNGHRMASSVFWILACRQPRPLFRRGLRTCGRLVDRQSVTCTVLRTFGISSLLATLF